MRESVGVEVIVRGVCVVEGHVLLCRGKKSAIAYLPGGHIEFRETARQALVRELQEELGVTPVVGEFLGCCEHAFVQNGEPHAEINLVFAMTIPNASARWQPNALESWIEFIWQPVVALPEIRAEPAALFAKIAAWLNQPGGHIVTGSDWLHP